MKKLILLISCLISVNLFGQDQDYTNYNSYKLNEMPTAPEVAAFNKYGQIPVSKYTGTVPIGVNLGIIRDRQIQASIDINYHSSGIRVEEIPSRVGMGWSLSTTWSVSRSVRGISDDWNGGWLNSGFDVESFQSLTQQEKEDKFALADQGHTDLETDLYSFNFPNGSGTFYFDNLGIPHLQEYSEFLIEYTQDAFGAIDQFIITAADGTKGVFGKSLNGLQKAIDISMVETITRMGGSDGSIPGNIPYNSAWHLIEIVKDYSKLSIEYEGFTLTSCNNGSHTKSVTAGYSPTWLDCRNSITQTVQSSTLSSYRPKKIIGRETTAEFYYGGPRLDAIGDNPLDSIALFDSQGGRIYSWEFSYDYMVSRDTPVFDCGTDLGERYRLRLNSLQKKGKRDKLPAYEFYYNSTKLPNRLSYAQDEYGYYNGEVSNLNLIPSTTGFIESDRRVNPNYTSAGVLEKIKYPTGGFTEIVYEQNDARNPMEMVNNNVELKLFSDDGIGVFEKVFSTLDDHSDPNIWISVNVTDVLNDDENGYPGTICPDINSIEIVGVSDPSIVLPITKMRNSNFTVPKGEYKIVVNRNSSSGCASFFSVDVMYNTYKIKKYYNSYTREVNTPMLAVDGNQLSEYSYVFEFDNGKFGNSTDVRIHISSPCPNLDDDMCGVEFYVIDLKDGSYYLSPNVNGVSYHVFEEGRYELKLVINDFNEYSNNTTYYLSYDELVNEEFSAQNYNVGGLRVSSLINTDYEGSQLESRSYEYLGDDGNSSGRVEFLPIKTSFVYNFVKDVSNPKVTYFGYCAAKQYHSNYINHAPVTQGSNVGYGKVTELINSSSGNLKTDSYFTTVENFPDESKEIFPFPPPDTKDWRRGLNIKDITYTFNGTAYVENTVVERVYKSIIPIGKRKFVTGVSYGAFSFRSSGNSDYQYLLFPTSNDKYGVSTVNTKSFSSQGTYETNTKYDYGYKHIYPTSVTLQDKNGIEIQRTESRYPLDYVTPAISVQNLISSNRIDQPSESYLLKNGNVVSGAAISWRQDGKGINGIYDFESGLPVLENNVYSQDGENFSQLNRKKALAYNVELQIEEIEGEGSIWEVLFWNDKYDNPIAHVQNANRSQVYFESFETTVHQSVEAIFGKGSFDQSSFTIPIEERPTETTNLLMSYWFKKNGVWKYSGILPYNPVISVTGAISLDEIRVFPEKSVFTSYYYKKGIGVNIKVDNNGITSNYEYDSFGRLQYTKDFEGNILQKYEYHYQNQIDTQN